jgi:hypothetical protein
MRPLIVCVSLLAFFCAGSALAVDKEPRPARTAVVVAGLVGPGNIEITAGARK